MTNKTQDNTVKKVLSLIYDEIKRIRGNDIYIVSNNKKCGLIDNCGTLVLPVKFSKIRQLNSRLLLLQEEYQEKPFESDVTHFEKRGLYDCVSKEVIVPLDIYSEVVKTGRGVVFGQDLINSNNKRTVNKGLLYVNEDGKVFDLSGALRKLTVIEGINDVFYGSDSSGSLKVIRVDKNLKVMSPSMAWDSLIEIDLTRRTIEEYASEYDIADKIVNRALEIKTAFPNETVYLAVTSSEKHLLTGIFTPLLLENNKRIKFKTIYV